MVRDAEACKAATDSPAGAARHLHPTHQLSDRTARHGTSENYADPLFHTDDTSPSLMSAWSKRGRRSISLAADWCWRLCWHAGPETVGVDHDPGGRSPGGGLWRGRAWYAAARGQENALAFLGLCRDRRVKAASLPLSRVAYPGPRAQTPIAVTTSPATTKAMPILRSSVGWVEAAARVTVRARIDGAVVERHMQDGAEVGGRGYPLSLDDRGAQGADRPQRCDALPRPGLAVQVAGKAQPRAVAFDPKCRHADAGRGSR